MEFALTNHWSANAEYMHFDLGKENFRVVQSTALNPVQIFADAKTNGDTVRIGLNYHFHAMREPQPFK